MIAYVSANPFFFLFFFQIIENTAEAEVSFWKRRRHILTALPVIERRVPRLT